ncbi:O-antigen ligase [Flavobacterium sp. H122]|uniref:O-antigen ligase family protein n=1 Tax=Flavobacterium sp. H122 TaxID=2529860 RepID=UPI0010AA6129|nr:O-antigen ligase family protein [Flavobacterium sp. H122]
MEEQAYKGYLKYYFFHFIIGVIIFVMPFLSKIYSPLIFLFGIYAIHKKQNKNHEALLISAYVVGAEVLLRMTGGMYFNEYGKYSIIIFMLLGMYYKGISKSAFWYLIFIGLLIPSIINAPSVLNYRTDVRKAIAFNISGPVCLAISALYCYKSKITFDGMKRVILYIGYPLLAILTYVVLYNPSIKEVVTSTQSNFETSGGFGPNQMSTVLGLGMFVFFVQFLLNSKNKLELLINGGIMIIFAYRCLVTFSRGGMLCALVMIGILVFITFFKTNRGGKLKIGIIGILVFFAGTLIWGYSLIQTNGLIEKRYANQDARGRVKESQLSGREEIAKTELKMFLDNPIFGVGVGKNKEYREEVTGIVAASHNEITRMLAEHGMLGVMGLAILFFIPVFNLLGNKQHIFLLSFFVFWLLTINHAAMRIAAPAFIYALSLLKVNFDIGKEDTLHRESTIG